MLQGLLGLPGPARHLILWFGPDFLLATDGGLPVCTGVVLPRGVSTPSLVLIMDTISHVPGCFFPLQPVRINGAR